MQDIYVSPLAALALVCLVLWCLLRWFPDLALDIPNERSLHAKVIPRFGGIGVVLAIFLAALPLAPPASRIAGGYVWALPLALLAGVSFWDDRCGLPVRIRLAAQGTAVGGVLFLAGAGLPAWALLAVSLLWIWLINLFNFMDGADGLAGGMAVVAFATLGASARLAGSDDLSAFSFVCAAASLGFLFFNLPPARVFLGDVGAISLGFLYGYVAFRGWRDGIWPFWYPPAVAMPFVLDASLTLLRRLLAGQPPWRAHREHHYQRLVRMGWSHARLLQAAYPLMLLNALLALGSLHGLQSTSFAILLPSLITTSLALAWVDIRWRDYKKRCVS